MRALVLALALTFGALAPLAGCASLGASIEQVQPRTAREALAVAEISFVGAVTAATELHAAGILSTEDARADVLPKLERINDGLALARRLMRAGDDLEAGRTLAGVTALLTELSVELARRRDEAGALRS